MPTAFKILYTRLTAVHQGEPAKQNMWYLLYLLFVACLCLSCRCRVSAYLPENSNYLTRERTCLINGIFTAFVFMFHSKSGYGIEMTPLEANVVRCIVRGQMVVSTFFFFTGYGIMCSLQRKGDSYARILLCNRFPKVLLHFAMAVLLFWFVDVNLLHIYPTWQKLGLALLTYESIGNSNWFITITLLNYLVIGGAFALFTVKRPLAAIITSVIILCFFMLLVNLCNDTHKALYSETTLVTPAGMLFGLYRHRVEKALRVCKIPTIFIGAGLMLFALVYYKYVPYSPLRNVNSIAYPLGVLLVIGCLNPQRSNPLLLWMGGAGLFSFYILQRIPFALFHHWGLAAYSKPLFLLVCFLSTLLLAALSLPVYNKVDQLLFARGKK